jgi:cyanophycin synthetase
MRYIPRTESNCIGSLLIAAAKYGVKVETLDEDAGLRVFSYGKRKYYIKGITPEINHQVPCNITADKYLTKRLLKKNHIPVPNGFKEKNLNRILKMIDYGTLKFPLVVKPVDGDQGAAVTVAIENKKWLATAVQEVFKFNRRRKGKPNSFLMEEYIPGDDYRFLVLDGQVLTVMMRKPAYIIGDGINNVNWLIDEYNNQPGVDKDQPLCPIVKDYELARNLNAKKCHLKTVLPAGKQLFLRRNANVSTGGRSFECADKAHPEYKKLTIRIAALFHLRFCSVDLLSPNIRFFKQFSVLEINSNPGFDIHEKPYRGRSFPVAEKIIKSLFKI